MDTHPPIRVLFIDRHQEDRRAWAHALKMFSPDSVVLEAETGAAGLAMCQSQRVDCVVVELTLPDMSGFQMLVDLVPCPRTPTVGVIMFTRLPVPSIADLAISQGAQDFLIKSHTSVDQLHTAIREAIAKVAAFNPEPLSGR